VGNGMMVFTVRSSQFIVTVLAFGEAVLFVSAGVFV